MSVGVSNDATKAIMKMTSDMLDRYQLVRFMDKKLTVMNQVLADIQIRNTTQAKVLHDGYDEVFSLSQHETKVTQQVTENAEAINRLANSQLVNKEKAGLINERLIKVSNINNNRNVSSHDKIKKYSKNFDKSIDNMIANVQDINKHIDTINENNCTDSLSHQVEDLRIDLVEMTKQADAEHEVNQRKVQTLITATNELLIIINSYAKDLKQVKEKGDQLGRRLEALSTVLLDVAPAKYDQSETDILNMFNHFSQEEYMPKEEPKVLVTNDGLDKHPTQVKAKDNKKHRWMFWK